MNKAERVAHRIKRMERIEKDARHGRGVTNADVVFLLDRVARLEEDLTAHLMREHMMLGRCHPDALVERRPRP